MQGTSNESLGCQDASPPPWYVYHDITQRTYDNTIHFFNFDTYGIQVSQTLNVNNFTGTNFKRPGLPAIRKYKFTIRKAHQLSSVSKQKIGSQTENGKEQGQIIFN